MMAAVIHQQIDAKIYGTFHGMHQTPGDTGRMLVPFHPDALLHDEITDGKTPDRDAARQPERFKMYKSPWLNRTAAPTIGKQRPVALIVMQRGISLGEDKQALQRGMRRSDKQTVITACQTLGNRAASISAQAIRQPPFTSTGLLQIATGCATEVDSIRQLFGYCQCAAWTIIDRSLCLSSSPSSDAAQSLAAVVQKFSDYRQAGCRCAYKWHCLPGRLPARPLR